jgi:hypothetical protein
MAAKNIQRRLADLIKRMKSDTDNDPGSTLIELAEIVRDMHVASLPEPPPRGDGAAQPEPQPRGDGAEVLPMVIADLQARSEMGRAKYGTTLRVNNGRNALMDAYQESLDQTMYLKQRLEEDRLRAEKLNTPPGMGLVESRVARLRKGNVACSHTDTIRGANIPLRYGSCRSEVCLNCGAFRERDHHGNLRSSWQPASEYAEAIADPEQD